LPNVQLVEQDAAALGLPDSLNALARERGEVSLTIPAACIAARRPES
jgi:hypothetical protein